MASGSGLEVTLDVAQPVVAGLPALALLHVVNRGGAERIVSARLNLMEGDVALTVHDPGGAPRKIAGWQADTALRRAELPPGCQLVGALLLLETPEGPIFPGPGTYRIAAEYRPSSREEPVASEPVPVTVVGPRSDGEKALADRLADPAVRRGILLADPESAPAALRDIGGSAGDTLTGRLARLVSGSDETADSAARAPVARALDILALRNPYNRTGERLAENEAGRLGGADSGSEGDRARRLLDLAPIPADTPLPI